MVEVREEINELWNNQKFVQKESLKIKILRFTQAPASSWKVRSGNTETEEERKNDVHMIREGRIAELILMNFGLMDVVKNKPA